MVPAAQPHRLVENFFRQQWRNIIASLTSQFGIRHLGDIENAVQSAMAKALDRWAIAGIPDNPGGWIYRTARHEFLDEARRRNMRLRNEQHVVDTFYSGSDSAVEPDCDPLNDDVLRMILVCSHPEIKPRDSAILTLRVVCGLGFGEIAASLCMSLEAVRKSLTRCKAELAKNDDFMDQPDRQSQHARLDRVLRTVYLLFDEGYFASQGDAVIRDDLCREAERLMELLRESSLSSDNRIWALSALLSFQASRLSARTSANGGILLLYDQDRGKWDQERIACGFRYFQRALTSFEPSRYHLEAAIAACHASAASYEETDWERIISYYDTLYEMTASPVVLMNRAVAVLEIQGPQEALKGLGDLEQNPHLKNSYVLSSVISECHKRLGRGAEAEAYLQKAIQQSSNRALAEFWSMQVVT